MTETFTLTFAAASPADVDLLGGKGAGLARMAQAGLRVPGGFIISTRACRRYLAEGGLPAGLSQEVASRIAALAEQSGKTFGGGPVPLLLSVRSGAPVSMPGMMDTILNLGLNRAAALALAQSTGDTRFMAELLARFHRMYSETVLGALTEDAALDELAAAARPDDDPGETYDTLWNACQQAVKEDTGQQAPADPQEQLNDAIQAVFRSWNTRRARTYRDFHDIPHDLGTAVVVQSMVFGNLGPDSGSGVVFTRNPLTGEPGLFGEFLRHSQGEDVVSGTRTPDPVSGLAASMPHVYEELTSTCAELERGHADVLDIEFTVERSTLYFLQVRKAKRTPEAAVRIAADLIREDVVKPAAALNMLTADQVRQVQRPGFAPADVVAARAGGRLLTTGTGACPGQASGILAMDPDRARELAAAGRPVILARPTTSPADLHGMIAAQGIVTATGGTTSHAAVIARALGKPCVVGCANAVIRPSEHVLETDSRRLTEGDEISLDGTTGEVFLGALAQSTARGASTDLDTLLGIARNAARAEVFGRVTLPGDVAAARQAGVSGLVTAVDDMLAATGHLDSLITALLEHADVSTAGLRALEDTIAAEFAPFVAAADGLDIGVRGIDFLADESREVLHQTALITRHPQLSMPLGFPPLVEAQIAGLARAAAEAGGPERVHFTVRHLSDAREAVALREIGERVAHRTGIAIGLGGYLTSPRGVGNYEHVARASEVAWVEVRVLQAATFGLPARLLLSQQPLDGYLRQGMLSTDPRVAIDPSVDRLLASVAALARDIPSCRVGLRLTGTVAEPLVGRLHELGFRRFAVESHEARPASLALGKAARVADLS